MGMTTFAVLLAVFAVIVAFLALKAALSAASGKVQMEAAMSRAESRISEAEQRAARVETFLKRMASGKSVDEEMIDEGRLFDEIDSSAAQKLVEANAPGLVVVDVRTEQEVTGGHIAGAVWIPVDQLEQRAREVPKEGKVLVFCAAGGRSAAACDYLSSRGWSNVVNVVGGMSAYRGKTASGVPARKS